MSEMLMKLKKQKQITIEMKTGRMLKMIAAAFCLTAAMNMPVHAEENDDPEIYSERYIEHEEAGRSNLLMNSRAKTVSASSFPGKDELVHDNAFDDWDQYYGIDVSEHNDTIDWTSAAAADTEFAIIRAGYRGYYYGTLQEDQTFEENIQNAASAGVMTGVYFFSEAITPEEAEEEAEFVIDALADYHVDLPIFMDREFISGAEARMDNAELSAEEETEIILAFCRRCADAGYDAGVYASASYLEEHMNSSEISAQYHVWVAQWNDTVDAYEGTYDFWQYSGSSDYRVDGISGPVDLDVWYNNSSYLKTLKVQNALIDLNYLSESASGISDAETESALREFQLLNGLDITGEADQKTQTKLFSTSAISFRTMSTGMKGKDVKAVQQKLSDLGYLSATPDGSYGNYTKAAVIAFQAANGMEDANGKCGHWTVRTLADDNAVSFSTLKKGNSGTAVKVMQKYLADLNYLTATPDGVFGNASVSALKQFQLLNGLKATGKANQATLAALYSANAISFRTMSTGMNGKDVKAVQQKLSDLGYLSATPDGSYGNYTKAAVIAFQAANGLEDVDGKCGHWTLNAMTDSNVVSFSTLKKGNSGTAVKVMQKYLADLNYLTVTPDGNFGSTSVSALRQFQLINSLEVTGTATQETLAMLYNANAISFRTMSTGMKGQDVKAVQQKLSDLGYLSATPDGSYGNYTKAAVKAFQTAAGKKTIDGKCGHWTVDKLSTAD